jgi:hypothetical protein
MIRKEARTPPGFLFVIFLNLTGLRDIFYSPSGKEILPAPGQQDLTSAAGRRDF